jgi:hypothetical protein
MCISNCPRCHDTFRVPLGDSPKGARAQCPWCAEEFPLAEVLNQLPPVLKIVSADPTLAAESGDESDRQPVTSVAQDTDQAMNLDLESFELNDDQPTLSETVAFDADITYAVGKSDDNDQSDNLVTSAPKVQAKRRAKSGGGLRTVIGVIVGSLLGALIAGGILWGLSLGPFADTGGPTGNRVSAKSADLSGDQNQNLIANSSDSSADVVEADSEIDTVDGGQNAPGEAELTLPEVDFPTSDDDQAAAEQVAQEVKVVDLVLQSESDELVSTAETAVKMVDAINRLKPDDENRTRWLARAYREIAKASDLAVTDGPSIQKLAQSIKESKILDELETAGSDWMETSARNNDGVLIIGTSDGKSVALSSGKTISISSSDSLPISGRVMVLGKVSSNDLIKPIWVESLQ